MKYSKKTAIHANVSAVWCEKEIRNYKLCKNKGEFYQANPEHCEKEVELLYACHKNKLLKKRKSGAIVFASF